MTVLPAGPKGSSFELIADHPCGQCARGWARQAQNGVWSGEGTGPADRGSFRRKVGQKTLSRRNMTFAADPQVNEPYPLGELSYVIVISEIVDWNRMPASRRLFFAD